MKIALTMLLLGQSNYCELPTADRHVDNSSFCLSCHDGSAGHSIGFGAGTHPMTADYIRSWSDGRYGLTGAPDRNFVFVENGIMTCTTCHDPDSSRTNHLAVELGQICTSCHARK